MKTIYKPWGKEEWIELNDFYCYKRIYINKGYKTSLQYHNFKRETNYIISGQAEIWLEDDNGQMLKKIYGPGEFYNVTPPKKHRVIALTDLVMQEVSTPEVDDVVRVEDDTNRPDGKIEGEHKTPAVLILCAGLGSRLKNLTNNINKTLLPINNKAIISHIIEKFPKEYEFVIALGYKGESVKEYCELVHSDKKITFVEIDHYDPKSTGPGTSAMLCSQYLQRPFYVVMGDCMIDSKLPNIDGNWVGAYPTSYPEKYSTINTDANDNVTSFINKNENGYDLAFIGLAGILDYELFWKELGQNIKDGEIVCAFENPEKYPTLKVKHFKWLDTGNLDDLEKAREYFNDQPLSLKKEIEEITYRDNGKFLKFINDKDLLNKRYYRGKKLIDIIPRNFNISKNFLYYDWINGKTPYEYDDINIFNSFLSKFSELLLIKTENDDKDVKEFYITKTHKRLNSFILKCGKEYYELEHEINGIKRPSLKSLLEDKSVLDVLLKKPFDFYENFHGDLHFENMVYGDDGNFYYIDWRDSFGNNINSGDVYYDLSKFYGGLLIPYNLMKDESNITYNEGSYSINYKYNVTTNIKKFKDKYEEWINAQNFDLNKIKLITGLIFLNMSPLHDGKFGKMLWFKSIEMIDEYEKNTMGVRM